MSRTKRAAAVAAAVVALGATSCGTSNTGAGTGTGATAAPMSASPRPTGTGPLTKNVVRTDLDTAAADAGLPANAPEFADVNADAPAGSAQACGIAFKGFGTKATPTDTARFDKVVDELRERDWQQPGDRTEYKGTDGAVYEAHVVLKQRGWTMGAEYRNAGEDGVITLMAFDDTCMKKNGTGTSPSG
ncbi:hypothetical protein [Streptomyces sp. NPDC057580]|uniref:hypothetical protein n=1 Tax=Streptomyces sp. NPDC057580 TaxID=3346173 RepID=UPI00367DA22A